MTGYCQNDKDNFFLLIIGSIRWYGSSSVEEHDEIIRRKTGTYLFPNDKGWEQNISVNNWRSFIWISMWFTYASSRKVRGYIDLNDRTESISLMK